MFFCRSGLSSCLRLRLHCRHVCRGLLASVCLFFLSSLLDVSGTDDQGVVLLSSALQPWGPGQLVSHSGPPLVHLLALSTHPITVTWRWNQLSGHRFPRTCSLTVDCLKGKWLSLMLMDLCVGNCYYQDCRQKNFVNSNFVPDVTFCNIYQYCWAGTTMFWLYFTLTQRKFGLWFRLASECRLSALLWNSGAL